MKKLMLALLLVGCTSGTIYISSSGDMTVSGNKKVTSGTATVGSTTVRKVIIESGD